jgi:hypothetical protein
VVERGKHVERVSIPGASLRALADVAGADPDRPFDVGHDTPPVGDPDEPLSLDADAASVIAAWFDLGWQALDAACRGHQASTIQLWPEHFDAGCDVAVGPRRDDRCNLGCSPGDAFHPAPYLYVGPWTPERPGPPGYWNAPFGAVLAGDDVVAGADPVAFLQRGLDLLR